MNLGRAVVAVCAVTMVGTACGSTVQQSSVSQPAGASGDGLGPAEQGSAPSISGAPDGVAPSSPPGGGGTGGTSGTVEPGSTGATTAAGSTGSGGGGSTTTGRAPAAAGVPARGRGWDESNVYIGVLTQKDAQQIFARFGADGVDPGNTEAQANAIAADLNRRGGILGRQVKIRFFDVKTLDAAQNGSAVGEAACTHFTQDAPVIAVWNISTQVDQTPTFRGCLASAKIPMFTAAARAVVDKQFRDHAPHYWHTVMVSWDRVGPVLVKRLQAQGWFGAWDTTLGRAGSGRAKVGVLVQGTPEGQRAAAVLTASLAASGYRDTVVYQYNDPSEGQASSVNHFKGKGVTHVIVTDVELTAFQMSAESQRFRPRYGITTYNAPYSNLEADGLVGPEANNGAMGIGWAPNFDVGQANEPAPSAGARQCQKLMAGAGQQLAGKRLASAYAFSLCDTLSLIGRGAQAGGGFTAPAVARGIVSSSGNFSPANGFAPALTADQPYVQGQARDLIWSTQCGCLRYGTGAQQF